MYSELTSDENAQEIVKTMTSKNKIKFLIVVVVVVVVFISGYIFWHKISQPKSTSTVNNITDSTDIDNTKTILKYFPNFGSFSIKTDSADSDYLWLLSQAGLMRINIQSKNITNYTEDIPAIKNKTLTDLVRVGDLLFVGFQGGFIKYDLKTKETRQYSTNDGLVSNSNLRINVDPSDTNVLWIGTFEGLSRFTISSSSFKNFQAEMGIPGTVLQPRVFHVDDKYVWLTIGAHAYTSGGVARLDKDTGLWKSWGNEFFSHGRNPSRFDTYGASADKEHAVVEDDGILYSYNSIKDRWLPITKYNQNKPVTRIISLKESNVYFISDNLKELNIETKEERDVFVDSMFFNTGISFEVFIKNLHDVIFDVTNNRFIIYPSFVSVDQSIFIFSLENKVLTTLPFNFFEDYFKLFNVTIADVNSDHIILKTFNSLVDYNFSKDIFNKLLPNFVSVAKIINNKVITLNLALCEMRCDIKTLVSSSTVISLETNKIESTASITGITTNYYHIGSTTDDIYLFDYDYKDKNKGYKFDIVNNKLNLVDLNFPHEWTPQENYNRLEERIVESSLDKSHQISFDRHQSGDFINFNIKNLNTEKVLQVSVGPSGYNHWTTNTETNVESYTFDSADRDVFWVGTDRGLIRINLSTLEYKLFTTTEGLFNDKISNVFSIDGGIVVVQHEGGIYVYNLKNKE